MVVKDLKSVELIDGFNGVSSALIRDNNLDVKSYEDFIKLFPDQAYPIADFPTFLEKKMEKLKYTDDFVKKLVSRDKHKKIIIAGDYDADGVMGTLILYISLSKLGYKVDFVIPDRHRDGYGLALDKILEKADSETLVITTDTGISEKVKIKALRDAGVDVIVTDHHLPTEENLPEDVLIIDPKLNGDSQADICGAMVAFKLSYHLLRATGFHKRTFVQILATLAGIATVADMMPVLGENRYTIKLALNEINRLKDFPETRYGSPLYKILNSLGCYKFFEDETSVATEELISFYIAPAINAVSRVRGDVTQMVLDFVTSFTNPYAYIPGYYKINAERQKYTNELYSEINEKELNDESAVIVIDKDKFQFEIKGILGLIANKVVTKVGTPALVGYVSSNGNVEFSGRGVPGYSLHDGFLRIQEAHPELSLSGGGHAQAMGLRFEYSEENLKTFITALNEDVRNNKVKIERVSYGVSGPEDVADVVDTMHALAPYGQGFQKIKFTYRGILRDYDNETKTATIGDFNFKAYLSRTTVNEKLDSEITVIFTIDQTNKAGAVFSLKEIIDE